ncbi:2,3-bisphosphoglycerate-independent phosphoglycerate mutase [Clostridium sp. AL.422]|uniref:2,3-bisphosphoglycerate-independent phosphoglycerate mutase n=1 Tax=Clostridium TaxID=1485 RepID=UPI00293DDC3B|nr:MULTISPECIES: 2,3-bisphosphoglycerate-independent phosphoglycerate mutase [unclassified Clostridium]MDV4150748.1 2,3-bisphosphoglycerate-independent phosphoglycerate mutase [Clostridium sp. AL.422]
MGKAKGILLISDGLGDRPIAELNHLTPLEYAKTPTMDQLCKEGSTGLVHPYRPGCRVGTDWGHICLFGYNPDEYYTGRGAVEAFSAGLDMKKGDVAFRGNLGTVDNDLVVLDRRAGRINDKEEIKSLIEAVDGYEVDGCKFKILSLTEHRVAVVMSGEGLDWHIVDTDPGTACEGSKIVCPIDESNVQKSAQALWKFQLYVKEVWDKHPVNIARVERGELPANFIITRGAAAAMVLPPIESLFPKVKVSVIAGDETITGIGKMCNFDYVTDESYTGGFETNYLGKAQKALEELENHDLVIVHIKGTDLCGHDNEPLKKAAIVEKIDEMYRYWMSKIDKDNTYLGLVADHSTPCHVRDHSADPVPAFLWGPNVRIDECNQCGERAVSKGILNDYTGNQFMATIMDYLGHTKKYGA